MDDLKHDVKGQQMVDLDKLLLGVTDAWLVERQLITSQIMATMALPDVTSTGACRSAGIPWLPESDTW